MSGHTWIIVSLFALLLTDLVLLVFVWVVVREMHRRMIDVEQWRKDVGETLCALQIQVLLPRNTS